MPLNWGQQVTRSRGLWGQPLVDYLLRYVVERQFGYAKAMMVKEIQKDEMMRYLSDALERGEDIGHYGRLVFVMVARHFGSSDELVALLTKDATVDEPAARALIEQVDAADYSPPKRTKILDFQARQDFPIIPNPEDPDCGNVYRDLTFPDAVYEHIAEYREAKAQAG